MMSGQSSVDREAHWRSVFQEHADSGLSIRRFCQNRGISEGSFFAWRKKLAFVPSAAEGRAVQPSQGKHRLRSRVKRSAGGKQPSPVSRRSGNHPTANPSTSFVELKLPVRNEPIEVVHPRGYVVRIPSRVDLDWLPQLFQMLDRYTARQE